MTRILCINLALLLALVCHAQEGNIVASEMFASMEKGDKAALLILHFGTTHDDTRTLTINAINKKATIAFPNMEIREAYTSRIVMNRLKQRGINKLNPSEALSKLKKEGYTHILIQSTNIIEGIEMEAIRKEVAIIQANFKEIRIGAPLLYTTEDYEKVAAILGKKAAQLGAIVLVGHGTYTPSTASYTMLDYMLKDKGYHRFYIGTIEGYPTFDNMLTRLKASGEKRITLLPLMFVAGEHAQNDIAITWKKALEKEGFDTATILEGLGENQEIQDLFIEHARFMTHHKMIDILDKKAKL